MIQRLGPLQILPLLAALMSATAGAAVTPSPLSCRAVFNSSPKGSNESIRSVRIANLLALANRFAPLDERATGPKVRVLLGAIEVGKVPGLTTTDGKPLNLSVGGIGTVMNDTWSAKAPRLAERDIETIAVTPLMRNINRAGLNPMGSVTVRIEANDWDVKLYEHKMPNGGRIVFMENEHFTQRFDAIPLKGSNIYEMRDLPPDEEGELEQQRIWSALSQAAAKVYETVGASAYIPQDGHLAPASYYIHRAGHDALTLAPVLHNERYFDSYSATGRQRNKTAKIWNVSKSELDEYFGHDDEVVMIAPAIRAAEQTGVFTGKSVSNNTTRILNRDGIPDLDGVVRIELFSRLAPEENFLANSNRPNVNAGLAQATVTELAADGIVDAEVVETFSMKDGYRFGGENLIGINEGKARAKRAVQKIFGLDVDTAKPLFVSFARLVEQKGLDFLVPNVMRILNGGGQLVVGGPVGDEMGASARKKFKALKNRLDRQRPDLTRNFVFIDGPVMGRKKALLLAGQDYFPVPSRFEPCGLTDVEALFMGGQAIAPRIGGLVKGKNTIKYSTQDPENQANDLGWAIDQALRLHRDYHDLFLRRQVAASLEDFSLERHLNQALQNQRVEIYYRILRELDQLVASRRVSLAKAKKYFLQNVFEKHSLDRAYLVKSLQQVRPDDRSALLSWVLTAE